MKIFHRMIANIEIKDLEQVRRLAFSLRDIGRGSYVVLLDTASTTFSDIEPFVGVSHGHQFSTRFTTKEVEDVDWLVLRTKNVSGYPQPDSTFDYRERLYDLSKYCPKCCMPFRQIAPFRLKGEMAWGATDVKQIHWHYGEYFVRREVYFDVLKPLGIGHWPVQKHPTGEELQSVVQLRIDCINSEALPMLNAPYEICPLCHRKKWHVWNLGPFPRPSGFPAESIAFDSQEYFGSGGKSFRTVFVSQEFRHTVLSGGIRGFEFYPVATAEQQHEWRAKCKRLFEELRLVEARRKRPMPPT